MRPLGAGDLDIAVRALLAVAPARRPALARRLVVEARLADRYRRRTGRWHPRHGGGSLLSAACGHPLAPRPDRCDRAWRGALAVLLRTLRDRP